MLTNTRFKCDTSMVSFSNVHSVEIDFRSLYGSTGELSIPCAFFHSTTPFSPNTCCITFMGISCTVFTFSMPMLRNSWYVLSPTMGIFFTDSGAKKSFSAPKQISFCPLGLASPVPILATVLFVDSANEIGRLVSLIIF